MLMKHIIMRHLDDARETHEIIKETYLKIGLERHGYQSKSLSLIDSLAYPDKYTENVQKVQEEVVQRLQEPSPRFNDLKVFNQPECKMLAARARFVTRCSTSSTLSRWIRSECPRKEWLIELSAYAKNASVCLGIKYHYLAMYGTHDYIGMVPCTEPVKKAIKFLFGLNNPTPFQSLKIHQDISYEIGVDTMTVNTLLWQVGLNL